jgi:hypothetical protein
MTRNCAKVQPLPGYLDGVEGTHTVDIDQNGWLR